MRHQRLLIRAAAVLVGAGLFAQAFAGELARSIQYDLVELGYAPGNTAGEVTTETIVAIVKFQAEHGLEVDGQATPQLAARLAREVAARQNSTYPAPAATATAAVPVRSPANSAEAQQTCLQEKIAKAEKRQRTRSGLGRLANAVGRIALRTGNYEVVNVLDDAQMAAMTVDDLTGAARDLGIAEDEIAACYKL